MEGPCHTRPIRCEGVSEPWNKGKTYPAEILTPDEIRAILAQCPATWTGTRDRALLVTMYRAGLRHAEASLQAEFP